MIHNQNRVGNFTSSEIVALNATGKQALGFGVPAITYIAETNMERLLGRSIDIESNAKPLSWGRMVEKRVFELLPMDYSLTSQQTDIHPTIDYWAGSKDGVHECEDRAVMDIKSPITLKSFVQLVMPLYHGLQGNDAINAIRHGYTYENVNYPAHKDGEKYYWQLVSNAVLNNTKFAELIVYMPYYSELKAIQEMADGECYWVYVATPDELPYIIEGGIFSNINIIKFQVPQEDKDLLTANVEKAGKLLQQFPHTLKQAA